MSENGNKKDKLPINIVRGNDQRMYYRPKYVGNIRCFFYKDGSPIPRIMIGPTWICMIPVLAIASILGICMFTGLTAMENISIFWRLIGYLLMAINIYVLFKGLTNDPGIPIEIFERYQRVEIGNEEATTDEESMRSSDYCERCRYEK